MSGRRKHHAWRASKVHARAVVLRMVAAGTVATGVAIGPSWGGRDVRAQEPSLTVQPSLTRASAGTEARGGGDPEPPPGFHVEERHPWRVVLTGGLLFGISYGVAALTTAQYLLNGSGEPWGWGFVPVAGPFVGAAHLNPSGDFAILVGLLDACLVVDGLAQAAGIGLLAYGLTRHDKVLVPNEPTAVRWMPRVLKLSSHEEVFGLSGTF